ncbi:MAG: hypothetical protein LQ343_003240 [Gyalolechia ehrenbergii]|nr:MAG: hypothetical protein LQ343_003240 [Gyalolechia ehrenbergii]
METITIPSPSAFLSSPPPVLQPSIDPPETPRVSKKAQKKQLKSFEKSQSKNEGIAKPKQSKSRNGCTTCKTKRLKCDETKPSCQQCQKRKVTCGGYKKDFKWRAFEESTFTTKPIPSPNLSAASTQQPWPITDNPLASAAVSLTAAVDLPYENTFGSDGSESLEDARLSGLSTPQGDDPVLFQSFTSQESQTPQHGVSGALQPRHYGPMAYGDHQRDFQALHDRPDAQTSCHITNSLSDDGSTLYSTLASSSTISESTTPQEMHRFLPGLGFDIPMMDPAYAQQPLNISHIQDMKLQPHLDISEQDDDVEDIVRQSEAANEWLMRLPSPSNAYPSSSSEPLNIDFPSTYAFPRMSSTSSERILLRFDQQTCGILSVKDGPTENPWRTMIWPLAKDSPALYHAIVSMTAFHTAKDKRKMRVEGVVHMRKSIKYLASGIANGDIRMDAALATTLALAFSESWDRHISTGIQHLRGAKAMVNQALMECTRSSLTPQEVERLRFLCNTWVYMDVIARLTSVDNDESQDFDCALNVSIGPLEAQHAVDPLMGCASTLFPLIGRVANLVRRVRRTSKNSIKIISQGHDLKKAIETWGAPVFFEETEDQSLDIQHSLDTAEAYRWATLLYLHQAVPEMPSQPAEELARKVIVYLLRVPLSSRAVIIQIYPLLAAGCEVASNEDRAWVEDRWAAMMQRMLIGNLDKCLEVVKEVWNRRDVDESEKVRSALRTVLSKRSSAHPWHVHPIGGKEASTDEHFLQDDRFARTRRKLGGAANAPPVPPLGRRRNSSETIQDLDYEKTVRGRLHWIGVMKDWDWEILLG